jgi:hypothetical protein
MINRVVIKQSPHKGNLLNLFLMTLLVLLSGLNKLNAQTSTLYDFNTAGQLTNLFNGTGSTGSVSEVTTGGIGNTGAINLPGSANANFRYKRRV